MLDMIVCIRFKRIIKKLINKGYPTDKINIAATLNKYNYKKLREPALISLDTLFKELLPKPLEIPNFSFPSSSP